MITKVTEVSGNWLSLERHVDAMTPEADPTVFSPTLGAIDSPGSSKEIMI